MRQNRTPAENRILDRIDEPLDDFKIEDFRIDKEITDAPDIVVHHKSGKLGIEIARLDFEDFCKWESFKPEEEYARAAEVTINLKKLLANIINKKRDKYQQYKDAYSLDKCWLILHNNVFDFEKPQTSKHPDRAWFEKYSGYELYELECPFDNVLFNLEHPNVWYRLFNKHKNIVRKSGISRWPTIVLREGAVQMLEAKVYEIDLSDNVEKKVFD